MAAHMLFDLGQARRRIDRHRDSTVRAASPTGYARRLRQSACVSCPRGHRIATTGLGGGGRGMTRRAATQFTTYRYSPVDQTTSVCSLLSIDDGVSSLPHRTANAPTRLAIGPLGIPPRCERHCAGVHLRSHPDGGRNDRRRVESPSRLARRHRPLAWRPRPPPLETTSVLTCMADLARQSPNTHFTYPPVHRLCSRPTSLQDLSSGNLTAASRVTGVYSSVGMPLARCSNTP